MSDCETNYKTKGCTILISQISIQLIKRKACISLSATLKKIAEGS